MVVGLSRHVTALCAFSEALVYSQHESLAAYRHASLEFTYSSLHICPKSNE